MKRALVLAMCFLILGVGVSLAAENDRVAPAGGPSYVDPTRVYSEGFEGVTFPPAGWTLVSSNPFTWYRATLTYYEGLASAQCDYDETYTGPQDEFLKFSQLIGPGEDHLNFAMMGSQYWSTAPYANYDMYVCVNGTRIWTWTLSRPAGYVNWEWDIFDINLSGYTGQTIEIAFEYAGYDGAQGNFDSVAINGGYVAPSGACCDLLGGCTYVQQASCLSPSVWHGTMTCSPNTCPVPPVNDVCETATQIPCGQFTITGNTTLANNNYTTTTSACTGYSQALGPDVTYYVDLVVGDSFSVTMTTGTGWDDSIYLVKDCGSITATCVAGDDQYPDGSTFSYVVPAGGAGRYYLIVDGYGSSAYGEFTITGTAGCTPPVPVLNTSWGTVKALFR